MGLQPPKPRSRPRRLPPIVWADLIFRLPLPQHPGEDAPTAMTRCPAGSPGQDLAGSRWGPRAGRRRERRKKTAIAKASAPKEEMASSPLSCCPSQPPAAAPRTKKILVDLRPILDSVVESPEPRRVPSRGAQGADGHGGSDGQTSSPAPRVDQAGRGTPLPPIAPWPQECQQEAVTSGQPESQAWGLAGTPLVLGREPGPPVSLPLLVVAAKASASKQRGAAETVGAPLGSQPGRSRGAWCDMGPAPLQEGRENLGPAGVPHPYAPTAPAWDGPARGPAGGCGGGDAVPLSQANVLDALWPPRSPDVQLPTRLLLRRLQETTSSGHHRLIAQTLRALRTELQDADAGLGSEPEGWRLPHALARSRQGDTRRPRGLLPAARHRSLVARTWAVVRPRTHR